MTPDHDKLRAAAMIRCYILLITGFGLCCLASAQPPPATPRAYEPPSSEPDNLFVIGDLLYFSADDGAHGTELWLQRTLDGAPELVKDLTPGPEGTALSKFSSVNGLLLFRVERNELGQAWVSDGTADGTRQLTPDVGGRRVDYYAPAVDIGSNRLLVFRQMDIDGDFWITDGTSAGTRTLSARGIRPYTIRFTGFTFGRLGNRALFRAAEEGATAGLFVTDGTDAGTQEVTRVWDGPGEILGLDDSAVFAGVSQDAGEELWITQGTAESTRLLVDLMPGAQGSAPKQFAAFGGRAFFAAQTPE